MKVYIVVSGEYSDTKIEGVYEWLENAEKFCAAHFDGDIHWGREYQIVALETLDGAIRADNKIVYVYHYNTDVMHEANDPKIMFESDFNSAHKDPKFVYVAINERNDKKAYKIAQDENAKRKAEREGII